MLMAAGSELSGTAPPADPYTYGSGPVFAHVVTFGAGHNGPLAGLVTFGGVEPTGFPAELRAAFLRHVRRGERVLVLTNSAAQMRWVEAQVALLTAPGGRA